MQKTPGNRNRWAFIDSDFPASVLPLPGAYKVLSIRAVGLLGHLDHPHAMIAYLYLYPAEAFF